MGTSAAAVWTASTQAGLLAQSSIQAFATIADVAGYHPTVPPIFIRTSGHSRRGDGGGAMYMAVDVEPAHNGKLSINLSDGAMSWFELIEAPVKPEMLGAKCDGVSFDEDAINAAHSAALARGTYVQLSKGTYIVRATKTGTGLNTRQRRYALEMSSNSRYEGIKGLTTIKLANHQSTDENPLDVNLFHVTRPVRDIHLRGIIFDMNGQNNPTSPNRASGDYDHLLGCCTLNITGNGVWVEGLWITQCEFNHTAGTTQLCIGQSGESIVEPLSRNIHIWDNVFRNNGLDTDDHSTIYGWCEDFWVYDNIFEQTGDIDQSHRNWVACEIHGSNSWFVRNRVKGYYRGCWISSNFTRRVEGVHIEGNVFEVWGTGPAFYRELREMTDISDVHITNNDIVITDHPAPIKIKGGIDIVTKYGVSKIFVRNNRIRAQKGDNFNSSGLNLGCTTPGETTSFIYFENNFVEDTVTGFYARVNNANDAHTDGFLDEIHEMNNTYLNLGMSSPSELSIGSRYHAQPGRRIGTASCIDNKYLSRDGKNNFDWGIWAYGEILRMTISGNRFDGMNLTDGHHSISITDAKIIHKVGGQLAGSSAKPHSHMRR